MYRYRRQHRVKHRENTDRWLVSYADYMTLMFALFVVLYAFVLMEKEEYHEVVSNLEQAIKKIAKPFPQENDAAGLGILPGGAGILDGGDKVLTRGKGSVAAEEGLLAGTPDKNPGIPLPELAAELEKALEGDQALAGAELKLGEEWLTLELPGSLLFASASATLLNPARELLESIAPVLKQANNYVRVRGYSDNRPVEPELFASNWDLSAARAAAVLRALVAEGIEEPRLALEGYGAYGQAGAAPEQRRKVVLALSVYGYQSPEPLPARPLSDEYPQIKEISMGNGGIRITTREDN
ncbi:OmpA family protein [Gallaecimonas sp. GXIMD4217]|uniref:OmpA family protein n=1 Tax=Gallaecimonas sp. GXIMD4217 TaxID=3131927 RepID=UPI00311AC9DD